MIETEEQEMLSGVMRLADRSARALMTPRRDVETDRSRRARQPKRCAAIRRIARPRIPVRDPATDEVLGVLYLTDAFAALSEGRAARPEGADARGAGRLGPGRCA